MLASLSVCFRGSTSESAELGDSECDVRACRKHQIHQRAYECLIGHIEWLATSWERLKAKSRLHGSENRLAVIHLEASQDGVHVGALGERDRLL
jgi:hypothetical protein